MSSISSTAQGAEHLANLRRLVVSRWVVLAAVTLLVLAVPPALALPLPRLPLLGIIGLTALFNGFARHRLHRASGASSDELFSQLLFDIVTLCALLFFSGGATNPLISLLLPPVAIAALTLPANRVVAIGGIAVGAYSLLMIFYLPLPLADASRATHLHLIGMWLTFVVSAAMIGWFVVRMTRMIRERDAELAAAREQALRDEKLMAMGTLAAGAAHELGTPLATMALITGELAADAGLPDAVHDDVVLLRQQIGVCKTIITGLSRRAGAERLENAQAIAADAWLNEVRRHWHAVRPQASSEFRIAGIGQAPTLVADPRLEQALLNLLNNAASACPAPLELRLDWSAEQIIIDIRDRGPGFPPEVLAQGGLSSFAAHPGGSGIGLLLGRAAIEQLGGRLTLSNPPDGGAQARIELPRNKPCPS